jgi:hypothetical protein
VKASRMPLGVDAEVPVKDGLTFRGFCEIISTWTLDALYGTLDQAWRGESASARTRKMRYSRRGSCD